MAALHGDKNLQDTVAALLDRHGIQSAVETGTFRGDTAVWLGQRVASVVTILLPASNRD